MMPVKKKTWTGARVREHFLAYFTQNDHVLMPSSSLVPYNDPTVFLTTAGMQQMVPFFLGLETPPSLRMTSCQKCFRTVDIEEVGDARHLTFFEMLGNFSVGEYFKEGAIRFAWNLLTNGYRLAPERLFPTVYPTDDEAARLWSEIAGVPDERITRLDDNWWDRGPTTPGPCGPDSEIYYDRGPELGCGRDGCAPGCDCDRYLEIWNLVFMQFNQDASGNKTPLAKKNIDTGMGLERLTMVLQDKPTVFETDLFFPIIQRFAQIAGVSYGEDERADVSLRVIADHGRGLVFLAGDGVIPSNEGRGYIFRRVLRRAVRHGKLLGIDHPFLAEAADIVIARMGDQYPNLREQRERIMDVLTYEERKFGRTLTTGLALLEEHLSAIEQRGATELPGELAFTLHDTHGFPLELTQEVAAERHMTVDVAGFQAAMQRQRERSRQQEGLANGREGEAWQHIRANTPPTVFTGYEATASRGMVIALLADGQMQDLIAAMPEMPEAPIAVVLDETPFYAESGGQVGDQGWLRCPTGIFHVTDTQRPVSGLIVHLGQMIEGYLRVESQVEAQVDVQRRDDTRRNHSATHLLHRALKDLLGESVTQRGSLVEPDRLRFDFNHPRALTPDEIAKIDRLVNEWIRTNFPVITEIQPLDQALRSGAMALFGEKYPDPVRVVTMGTSKELCGGTHVAATGQIGIYVTTQEASSAAGIRRIEALTGRAAEAYLTRRRKLVDTLASHLQTSPDTLDQRVDQLASELASVRRQLAQLQREAQKDEAARLAESARQVRGSSVVAAFVTADTVESLREQSDALRERLTSPVIVLAAASPGGVSFVVSVSPDLVERGIDAGQIAREFGALVGGKGGGNPRSAQGGGRSAENIERALAAVPDLVARQMRP
jgi:alanyl-tRNA synthetase